MDNKNQIDTQVTEVLIAEIQKLGKIIMNITDNRYLSIKEAAIYMNISESTIRRAIAQGKLRCSRRTGKILFKVMWIDQFLEQ